MTYDGSDLLKDIKPLEIASGIAKKIINLNLSHIP